MKTLLNSSSQLLINGYKLIQPAKKTNQVKSKAGVMYTLLGQYSIETQGKERKLLFIKAVVISILTLGLGLFSSEVCENLKGRRIDVIYLKQNPENGITAINNVADSTLKSTTEQPPSPEVDPKTNVMTKPASKPDQKENSSNSKIPTPPLQHTSLQQAPQKPNLFITQPTYKPNEGETISNFRARVFKDTVAAYEHGYKKGDCEVAVDNGPMLNETLAYDQIENLSPPVKTYKTEFRVSEKDTFQVLLEMKAAGVKNPVGINMANRFSPGGGVVIGCPAQEEALCRRSNHYVALTKQQYPFPDFGGIYCPHVKIFRNDEKNGYSFMDKPEEVALVAIAAYNLGRGNEGDRVNLGLPGNTLSENDLLDCVKYKTGMKNKIRNMLRIIATKGHTHLVLGALGCGAFYNPPKVVASLFADVFNEPEFKGRFEKVDFAILVLGAKDQYNVAEFNKVCNVLNQ